MIVEHSTPSPAEERFAVGIVIEKRHVTNPWIDHLWLPVSVLSGAPSADSWTVLSEDEHGQRFYAGTFEMSFFSAHTANYLSNLETGAPKIWIAMREAGGASPILIAGVTADPAEGESFTEAGNDIVETVPMPPEIAGRLLRFVSLHHVERVFYKRRRDEEEVERDENDE